MTKEEWKALNRMVGVELKHPQHGLIVTHGADIHGRLGKLITITFRADSKSPFELYLREYDSIVYDRIRKYLRDAYDTYLKQLNND